MKTRYSGVFVALALFIRGLAQADPDQMDGPDTFILARDGRSAYALVVPSRAPQKVADAAEEFAGVFTKLSGVTLPMLEEQ
jgi:hypothetical protein